MELGQVVAERAEFLSTPSARRATPSKSIIPHPPSISIHALREEGDSIAPIGRREPSNFYPRPPRGGRPSSWGRGPSLTYFYPRPPRGGRRLRVERPGTDEPISIHALREEGDNYIKRVYRWCDKFLSTPSARRAT